MATHYHLPPQQPVYRQPLRTFFVYLAPRESCAACMVCHLSGCGRMAKKDLIWIWISTKDCDLLIYVRSPWTIVSLCGSDRRSTLYSSRKSNEPITEIYDHYLSLLALRLNSLFHFSSFEDYRILCFDRVPGRCVRDISTSLEETAMKPTASFASAAAPYQ